MKSALFTVEPDRYGKVAVVGDLHGDYKSLQSLLELVDLTADLLVFLGDYADRGSSGVEVIRKVAQLYTEHPENVLHLMGNHEDYSAYGDPQFNPCTLIHEAEAKVGSWSRYFQDELKPFIEELHLCALIPDNALLVHGGVSSKIKGVSDLEAPSDGLRADLLWSDPMDGEGEVPNWMRGVGVEWGVDVSEAVCRALGVERIIRSHQPQLAAKKPHVTHGDMVITLNATTVYGGAPSIYFIDPKSTKKDHYRSI